ncbi:MAG: oligopeptide transporter, OPT family [Ignavibacteriaceae bacterium]
MQKINDDSLNEEEWLSKVYRGNSQPELTIKAIIIGAFLSVLLISSNIYMGLKTSFTEGGSILSAILAFVIIKSFRGKLSILENNIAQTMASSAASIGIMVSVIPALILMGYNFSGFQLFLWIFLVSILGILFAVPLRKQMVIIERLPFPSGTACAETISAMHADSRQAVKKSKILLVSGLFASIITWFRDGVPAIVPYITNIPGGISKYSFGQLSFGINWSPMLLGVGVLVGKRIGLSLLLGAVIGWGFLPFFLADNGIISGVGYKAVSGWTMWLAISLMVSAGLTSFFIKWKIILRAFESMKNARINSNNNIEFPFKLWLILIIGVSLAIAFIMAAVFLIPFWMSLLAIFLSYFLAVIAIRAYGETDINPIGAVGHATQIFYGIIAPGKIIVNVMAAGITASGADQSADLMQDLKTGYLLGATPKKQAYAQFIGAAVGSIVAVPIFLAVTNAYGIGTEILPAPSAVLWKGLAELLSQGLASLPNYAFAGILSGAIIGIILALSEKTKAKKYLPSPIGMGIGIIVPAFFSVTIFLGSLLSYFFSKKFSEKSNAYSISIASGAIAGESITGVIIAFLSAFGVM